MSGQTVRWGEDLVTLRKEEEARTLESGPRGEQRKSEEGATTFTSPSARTQRLPFLRCLPDSSDWKFGVDRTLRPAMSPSLSGWLGNSAVLGSRRPYSRGTRGATQAPWCQASPSAGFRLAVGIGLVGKRSPGSAGLGTH